MMADIKLTRLQQQALVKVCQTNGGGVRIRATWRGDEAVPTDRVMRALFDKGLIQGKAGGIETVVHTHEGLALYRETIAHMTGVEVGA